MKIRKTIQFFCLLSTAVMAGCSLDKPIQFGMDCDADRIELESGKVCFPGECPEYEVFFEHKKCPSDAPYCSWLNEKQNCSFLRQICEASFVLDEHGIVYKLGDDDKFDVYLNNRICPKEAPSCKHLLGEQEEVYQSYCSSNVQICPPSSHPFGVMCELDTPNHCGSHSNNCYDEIVYGKVKTASCSNGACVIMSCSDEYTLENGRCELNNHCCGENCDDCTTFGPNKVCIIYENESFCSDGCPDSASMQCNGVCIDPQTSIAYCGSSDCKIHYCADSVDGWRDGSCINGKCRVSDCLNGYHFIKEVEGDGYCELDKPNACGNDLVNCSEIPNAKKVDCIDGKCIVYACTEGYFLYEGSCISSDAVQCGDGNIFCLDHQHCNQMTLKCECDSDYIDNGKICCKDPSHGTVMKDNAAVCNFTCDDGYHRSGLLCVENQCDNGQNMCQNDGFSGNMYTCINNEWRKMTACDNGNSCNPDGTKCGECINEAIECSNTTPVYPQHCVNGKWSQCGSTCSDIANGSYTCTQCGGCTYSCNEGYILSRGVCVDNSCENIGSTRCTGNPGVTQVCKNHFWEDLHDCGGNSCDKNGIGCGKCLNNTVSGCVNDDTTGIVNRCINGEYQSVACDNNYSCNADGTDCGVCVNGSRGCKNKTQYNGKNYYYEGAFEICESGAWKVESDCYNHGSKVSCSSASSCGNCQISTKPTNVSYNSSVSMYEADYCDGYSSNVRLRCPTKFNEISGCSCNGASALSVYRLNAGYTDDWNCLGGYLTGIQK